MGIRKQVLLVSTIFLTASATEAALIMSWMPDSIDAIAFTTGNTTVNGVLPAGAVSYSLHGTFTNGTRMAGGAARLRLSTGSFYRYSSPDPQAGGLALSSFTRPGAVSEANPAERYTSFVSYPNVLSSDPNSGGVMIVGALFADGTQGAATEAVIPGTTGNLLSVVWHSAAAPAHADGDYVLMRVTIFGATPIFPHDIFSVSSGSVISRFNANGDPGSDVAIPQLPLPSPPEPIMGFALAGLGMLGLRRRK